MAKKTKIGITIGDPAGIGLEIIDQALDAFLLKKYVNLQLIGDFKAKICPGRSTLDSAKIAYQALIEAVALLKEKKIDALVTAPICKKTIQQSGFAFKGHTDFLANEFNCPNVTMIMTGLRLTLALCTVHIPLNKICSQLTQEKIIQAASNLVKFLQLKYPNNHQTFKIAVAGLNPHAGEQGLLGSEEKEIIIPSIEHLNKQYSNSETSEATQVAKFTQPQSPDTVFLRNLEEKFDAVLCMYHDQALIPLKLLDFENAVNVSMGLPFIRTSPAHGTAFDIAGKKIANHKSMLAAINLATKISYKKINKTNF